MAISDDFIGHPRCYWPKRRGNEDRRGRHCRSTAAVRAGAIPIPGARSLTGQAGSAFNVKHLNDIVAGGNIIWGPPRVRPHGAVSTSAGRRLLDIEAAPIIGIRVVDAARSWGIELHPQVGRIG